ncbi:tetratricopeptide (TPR) repeat protein/ABC-type oligopeptide transport system ATPase subunit [Peribacillus deserti]|uniref:Tetratricopeptide (TPR) repeat protein/ABC-type oligopeptide transport system ATPase subunit n=1 Tax=Peribacillus deserti TaxID=673318 RepID=A0ABS2QI27_9BACI|nr:GTP-binding protein [Peribacillus deserti]MBM7692811.1 tetratricopeptide (TPR) repeat protein/ABC-type oligopeptide transport system ATPase subunit [Peribacillus deserti]
MTLEKQLVEKTFYEAFLQDNSTDHPVSLLGEALFLGQHDEAVDISNIRYAQGEVYFHHKDYESAVFKWEHVANALQLWASKNIGDAFYAQGNLTKAEEIYLSIKTDDMTLKSEVALQLFSLYIKQEKLGSADDIIKNIVAVHPDYPTLTEIARVFYEENKDWNSAVELAVSESVRTRSESWFEVLISYVNAGAAVHFKSDYFNEAIISAKSVDFVLFERLTGALWNQYRNQTDSFLQWISNITGLLNGSEAATHSSEELSAHFKETYLYLVNGNFTLKTIQSIVPDLVSNWLGMAGKSDILFASAAVLSWSELFPESISQDVMNRAEHLIYDSEKDYNGLENGIGLYQSIVSWAGKNEVSIDSKTDWVIQELQDLNTRHILVAGNSGNGKFTFSNSLIGEAVLTADTSGMIAFKNHQDVVINKISDVGVNEITHQDFYEITGRRQNRPDLIEFNLPSKFLRENRLSLLETPAFNDSNPEKNPVFSYLHFADSLLYILNADDPFTAKDRENLMLFREKAPDLPIHFIINSLDAFYGKEAAARVVQETAGSIHAYFPNANVFAYSSEAGSFKGFRELSEFIQASFTPASFEKERTAKLLFFIRQALKGLIDKRLELEKGLDHTIGWDVDMLSKLKGASNQLGDLEKSKAARVQKSFSSIKSKVRAEMEEKIPKILQKTADIITEDTDVAVIENKLNDEMNQRVESYIDRDILPRFYLSLQEWIKTASSEFNESQVFLDEMKSGFNKLYREERLELTCDFKVLDDWRRDADRMTGGFALERVNFLNRSPQQFLLKSAGKLFGALSQNNSMLHNKYKQYVENEDYSEAAKRVTDKFLMQFDMFEKSMERDVKMFFKEPNKELNSTIDETEKAIANNTGTLEALKQDPAAYYDPLTLFEVRLRSYEWIMIVDKEVQYIY